ncbi:bacteriohemerythrin [Falcatimonas sp. MSJ-15]|uniref:bacteriohemerythrin n=1 Tax=Falcatimonas sp. MSJ-15 TaxID=2841515 RepID=UPI001C116A0A|nr:bacteriohemerythrin [Falcatimonas sp. MSJ-15]MBU5470983.1 bacteriohemerythrin [Falcatimonas sp. MSJ-15]
MYEFTKDCMINIEQIDNEHRQLFQVINESIELINKTDDVMPLCNNLLKSLKDYSLNHFAHEEAYMEEINDPELSLQKKEHAAFAEKINNFKLDTSSKENAKKSLNELLTYLVRWLYHHILSSDMMIGKMSASANEVKDSSIFDFSEKYMTGIELVDDEHRHLFEIIKGTNDVINAAYLHDKYDEIMRLLSELKDYTESHFHDEEELMLRINYPHINSQKHAHSAFIEKLVNINLSELDNIDDNQDEYLNELITFLLQWLSNHILGSDKKIGEYIKSHPELKSKI